MGIACGGLRSSTSLRVILSSSPADALLIPAGVQVRLSSVYEASPLLIAPGMKMLARWGPIYSPSAK